MGQTATSPSGRLFKIPNAHGMGNGEREKSFVALVCVLSSPFSGGGKINDLELTIVRIIRWVMPTYTHLLHSE